MVPYIIAFSACAIQKVGSAALLCVSGARIFDFTGALPQMLDQLPVAPRAGPFDLGWRSGRLFVTATPLMKDAGRGAIEGFVKNLQLRLASGVPLHVSSWMFLSLRVGHGSLQMRHGWWLRSCSCWGWGGGAKCFMFGVFTRIPEDSAALTTRFCVYFGQRVLFRGGPAAGVCSDEESASLVGQVICFVVARCF